MRNKRYDELNMEIEKFIQDKKVLISRIPIKTIKNSKKELKTRMNETISDLIDPVSYSEIAETKISTIYNNITIKSRSVSIKPRNGYYTINDVFNIITKFIEKDMKKMLSDKYFIEAKKYKSYINKEEENIVYDNLKSIIQIRKDIIQTYLIFILSFYKKLPSLLKDMRG